MLTKIMAKHMDKNKNKKDRRLHAELCADIESVDLVLYLVCVDLPLKRSDLDPYKLDLSG